MKESCWRHSASHPTDSNPGRVLFDLNDHRTFRDNRRVRVDIRSIFLDPIARNFQALVGTCLSLQTVTDIPPSSLRSSM